MLLPTILVVLAVWLIVRRYDIRLVLLGTGLALATLGGRPLAMLDTFATSMVAAMVAPICAAMGFAAVLSATGCDRHLVRSLTAPLRLARWAAVPGGIAAAYLVNLAVPSQASVAAMLGPILIPLLIAAGLHPARAGAALVLGASFGGDLLSPAAQDVQALAGVTGVNPIDLSSYVIPASLAGLPVAALVFTILRGRRRPLEDGTLPPVAGLDRIKVEDHGPINPFKALIPLIPVTLLLLSYAGWWPLAWLIQVDADVERSDMAAAIPVVRALLIGVGLAAIVGWKDLRKISSSLFEGMGTAYRDIISLTISAQCFGAGIMVSGLGDALLSLTEGADWRLSMLSIGVPWGLATLSGSGSGPVLAFARACLAPLEDRPDLARPAALTCLAAAFGRTMSPVSAVVITGSGLSGVSPADLVRRLLPALLVGGATSLAVVLFWP
ncbi:anaerobic C4-dicarboxylate transporter DcuC [soil metagenome]